MKIIKTMFTATREVFSNRRYLWLFVILLLPVLFFFLMLPVWTVPGNDIAFQLTLFTPSNYILFAILAPLISLVLTIQVFIFMRAKNAAARAKAAGSGAVGGYAGVLGAVFATAACSWCVAAVFGFLGSGAVLFIAENQIWSVLVAIAIMFISFYFASKKVVKDCGCEVVPVSNTKNINNQSNTL